MHRKKKKEILKKELSVDGNIRQHTANELGVDGAAVAGVSMFDILYNTVKLNPQSVKGISHLHHAQDFESLGELMSFLEDSIIESSNGGDKWRQMIHKYKGYTGEENAFSNLEEGDHNIEVPESGTAEGMDVKVDGDPYNVKVTDNPSYIQRHLDENPDVDVIANREMAEAFKGNPRVLIDENLSSEEVFHQTADTFEAASDIGNLVDGVPVVALAINTVKNGNKIYKGDISLGTAAEHTVLDTAGTGVGGWAGGKVGLAAGMALTPLTGGLSAIFIPTASTLIGSIIGIFTGKGIAGWFKRRHLRSAMKQLKSEASNFCSEFLRLHDELLRVQEKFFSHRREMVSDHIKSRESIFKRVLFPSTTTMFGIMADKKLRKEHALVFDFYRRLKNKIKNKKKSEGGMILYSQEKSILEGVGSLPDKYDKVDRKLRKLEEEKKKIN
jgi:hypothetical protein